MIECELCRRPMKERIKHFLPQMRKICHAKKCLRGPMLERANHCFIHFVSDCCFGVLKKFIMFPKKQYKRLKPYEGDILKFGHANLSNAKKRELLVSTKGGFLPLLLPALASAVFGILGSFITKHI